jgi:hypothetical protein
MERKKKRARGGQPGNQNARKHGFYSSKMSPDEVCRFWNIVNLKGVEPEVVAFRLKLHSVLKSDPGNRRALMEAVKMITRYYKAKFHMNGSDTSAVRRAVKHSVEQYVARSLSSPVDRPELSGEILQDESRSFNS